MKILISVFMIFGMISAQAEEEYTKVEITEHAITWINMWDDLNVYIPGLENGLFKNLKIKKSKGPNWKMDAEYLLLDETDVDHASSYWAESYDENDCPNFDQDDIDYADYNVKFNWYSVKKMTGSQKSLMYVLEHYIILTSGQKTCELGAWKDYVFLNKHSAEGDPIYLGERKKLKSVPQELLKGSYNEDRHRR